MRLYNARMTDIYPFRGYRYAAEVVGGLENVVTQPYDKISDDLREVYLRRSPFNIVRVIRNPDYEDAARHLNEWIHRGVLRQDEQPALYVYEQTFPFEGEQLSRRGVIGLIALDDPASVVHGHENVLEEPLQDRLRLIRATEANEGLVFTLFSDPSRSFDDTLEEIVKGSPPAAEVSDDFDVVNRLWPVHDPGAVRRIQQSLGGSPLFIADGHHRFQTSLLFHRECREKGWRPRAPESFDKRMVAVFNMESEGMRILPTHRGIVEMAQWDPNLFLPRLREKFRLRFGDVEDVYQAVRRGDHVFGFAWLESGSVRAVAAELDPKWATNPDFLGSVPEPLRFLDVILLHHVVLDEVLGVKPEDVAAGRFVRYYREREALLEDVRQGEVQLACLLKPTSLQEVKHVAERGFRMPQKSTDFYPKLLTGLVLMKMQIER